MGNNYERLTPDEFALPIAPPAVVLVCLVKMKISDL